MQTHHTLVYEQLHALVDGLLEQTRRLVEAAGSSQGDIKLLEDAVEYFAAALGETQHGESPVYDSLSDMLDIVERLLASPAGTLDAAQERILGHMLRTGGDLREVVAELFGK